MFAVFRFVVVVSALLWGGAATASPSVVVTIKPVHSLVSAVMDGVGMPHLLVRGGASPHDFSLKPSDARHIARADLVFLVGGGLETGLAQSLASLAGESRLVHLIDVPGLIMRSVTTDDSKDGEGAHGHGHNHDDERDPHVWLDPRNAQAIVAAVAEVLAQRDPVHAERYRANARSARRRLAALDGALARRLRPVRGVPYVVFHDAYGYLAARYGLNQLGHVSVVPGRSPGARHLVALRATMRAAGVHCLFSEPQFPPRQVQVLADDVGARIGVLDALGSDVPEGAAAYEVIMTNLADAMVTCLRSD